MAKATAFAYNTGSPISGTVQVGSLAVGIPTSGFGSTGLTHWNGPDQDLGYVIAYSAPSNNHPTPDITNKIGLSSTYRGTDVNLSNSAQTASQQFGYQQSVLGVSAIGSGDKKMFSIRVSLAAPGTLVDSHFIGIGKTTMNYQGNPYGAYPGNDNLGYGYGSGGVFYHNGTLVDEYLTTWGNNDLVDICINNVAGSMWFRVNGGYWNDNSGANPATNTGGFEISAGPWYPALCPGYEGTMTIQNISKFSVPQGFTFLGKGTASLGFVRSLAKTEGSFISKAEEVSQNTQNFTTGTDAKTWLNSHGYWTSYLEFSSSINIATNAGDGLTGFVVGGQAVAFQILANPAIGTTYPIGSTIIFQNGEVREFVGYDDYGSVYDMFYDSPISTGTLFPITIGI